VLGADPERDSVVIVRLVTDEPTLLRLTRQTSPHSDRARKYRVLLDGDEVARLKWGERLELPVSPGSHRLRLKIDWTGSPELQFTIEPGQALNFVCRPARSAVLGVDSLFESIRQRDRWLVLERA
jgi:hypothetical protein